MKKKKQKLSTINMILLLAFILITVSGVSYAFFTANLTGGEATTSITVGGGTMGIAYSGGAVINVANIYPKADAITTKTFTVTGTSTTDLSMPYKLTLQVVTNTFSATALKWRLTSTNTGLNGTPVPAKSTDQNIGTGASAIVLGNGSFTSPTSGAKVHTYGLSLYFPDTGSNQNADQGKSFTAYVIIENVL